MSARTPSSLKRSLLSGAIALAAGGFAQCAMADGIVINLNPGPLNACYGTCPIGPGTGQVSGPEIAATDTVTVLGPISVVTEDASYYPAVLVNGDVLGEFINSDIGTINAVAVSAQFSALAHALSVTGAVSGSLSNNGLIRAYAKAGDGTSRADAYGISVPAIGAASPTPAPAMVLINFGSVFISGSGSITAVPYHDSGQANAYPINGSSGAGVTVAPATPLMNSGITASASFAAEVAALAPGAAPLLLNTGTIVAIAVSDTAPANAYGIDVGMLEEDATLQNTGLIYARGNDNGETWGIRVGNGAGRVLNSGAIYGGVSLGGSVSLYNTGGILTRSGQSSHVSGNYTQAGDGLLDFGLQDSSHYGRVTIAGTADFTSGNLLEADIEATHSLADGDHFNDVISAGTLTATSFHVIDNSVFWNFTAAIDGNTVDLTAHKVAATDALAGSGFALSPSLAALVDGVISEGNDGHYAALANALNTAASANAAAAILQQLGPVMDGGAAQATRASGAGAARALDAHIAETRGASSGDAVVESDVWIKPFIGKATQDAANGINGYDVDSSGFMIGVDTAITNDWQLGLAYAGSKSNVDGSAGSTLDITTTQLVVYGAYAIDSRTTLDLNLGVAGNAYDNHRTAFGGGIARATYHGTQLSAGAELSRYYKLNSCIAFIPSLALRVDQIRIDAYNETGAMINLNVQGSEENAALLTARGRFEWSMGRAGMLLANLGISSLSSDAASVSASLSGNGPAFVSNGISPDSWRMSGGIGYRYVTKKTLALTAAYDLEGSTGFSASTASVKLDMPF